MSYIGILVTYIFVNNFILVKFMGICPFIGVSKNSSSAIGMGVAVTFVTSVTSVVCWMVYYGLLAPFGLEYLRTISFILVIAAMVQLVEMVIRKFSPSLYKALGIYLPLITTNCAVLGVAILVIQNKFSFLQSIVYALATAIGFALALVVFAGLREQLSMVKLPKAMQGMSIVLVTAGLLSLAFMGFSGVDLGLKALFGLK